MKCDEDADRLLQGRPARQAEEIRHSLSKILRHNRGQQIRPVQTTPDDEGPVRAVPQPAHQEHYHQVAQPAPYRHPVAAKRDVEVILEPARERDMPAFPELRYRLRKIGSPEIDHQVIAQDAGRPYGYIGVPGEIAEYLEGEEICGCDQCEAR